MKKSFDNFGRLQSVFIQNGNCGKDKAAFSCVLHFRGHVASRFRCLQFPASKLPESLHRLTIRK
jgi:hypothetical protein